MICDVSWASAGITASPCCHSKIKFARAALGGFRVLLTEREKGQPASFQNMLSALKPQPAFSNFSGSEPLTVAHMTQRTALILGKWNPTQFCRRVPAPLSKHRHSHSGFKLAMAWGVTFSETLHLSDSSPGLSLHSYKKTTGTKS